MSCCNLVEMSLEGQVYKRNLFLSFWKILPPKQRLHVFAHCFTENSVLPIRACFMTSISVTDCFQSKQAAWEDGKPDHGANLLLLLFFSSKGCFFYINVSICHVFFQFLLVCQKCCRGLCVTLAEPFSRFHTWHKGLIETPLEIPMAQILIYTVCECEASVICYTAAGLHGWNKHDQTNALRLLHSCLHFM